MGIFGNKPEKEFLKAAKAGNLNEIQTILKACPDRDFLTTKYFVEGDTPLHLAAKYGHLEVVEFLLSKGADVHVRNNSSSTPLGLAVRWGQLKIVDLLISCRSDINERSPIMAEYLGGESLLLGAILALPAPVENGQSNPFSGMGEQRFRKDIVKLLIDKGADVNAIAASGLTPLYLATLNGNKDLVELLITKGADVNTHDKKYRITPLHLAAEDGHKEIIMLLLESGADVNPIDIKKDTPLDIAKKNVVDLLISKGAKSKKKIISIPRS